MKWQLGFCITIIFIPILLSAQESPAVFTIEGFSSSQLVWQGLDEVEPEIICDLGTTPNHLAIHDNFLYVVHSGSFSDGTGAELWRVPVTELLEDHGTDWQVLELPLNSNPWDIAFSSQDQQLAFVSLLLQNTVAFIDLDSWSTLYFVPTLPNPQGMVEFDGRLYVCASGMGSGSQVSVIEVAEHQQVDVFEVATNPQVIEVGPDGLLNVLCSGVAYPPDNAAVIQWLIPLTGEIVDELELGNNSRDMTGREDGVVVVGDEWTDATDPVLFYDSQTHLLLENSYASGGFALAAGSDNCVYIGSGVSGELVQLDEGFNVIGVFSHAAAIVDIVEYFPLENVAHTVQHPTAVNLVSAAPNPFNPGTMLRFDLPQSAQMTADLYDLLGRHCRHISLEHIPAGQQFYLDGSNLTSGVYFLHLQVGSRTQTLKLTRLP